MFLPLVDFCLQSSLTLFYYWSVLRPRLYAMADGMTPWCSETLDELSAISIWVYFLKNACSMSFRDRMIYIEECSSSTVAHCGSSLSYFAWSYHHQQRILRYFLLSHIIWENVSLLCNRCQQSAIELIVSFDYSNLASIDNWKGLQNMWCCVCCRRCTYCSSFWLHILSIDDRTCQWLS